MTEEQHLKFGTLDYDKRFLEEHFDEKVGGVRIISKETGVSIKVKTLEEQKREEEEKEKKRIEDEKKEKEKQDQIKPAENIESMFDSETVYYTKNDPVFLMIRNL